MKTVPLLALVLWATATEVSAHVALTFPPARYPPLDFLDNARTESPCGVPRPQTAAAFTNLYTNIPYNFTWRMQYPHQGGYRLTLLDSSGRLVQALTGVSASSQSGYAGLDDQTAQESDSIVFTQPCAQCVIRLERQALEWGGSYSFHSCSDVNIVPPSSPTPPRQRCSDAGSILNGQCRCDALRSGSICQYTDFCSKDEDCHNGGQCVEEQHSLVRKTCYCASGYFGKNCDQRFPHTATDLSSNCFNYDRPSVDEGKYDKYGLFQEKCYQKQDLNGQDIVYYRTVGDEVEVIMDYVSSTWVGLGWRPRSLDGSCRQFPELFGRKDPQKDQPNAVPVPEPAAEPAAEPAPEPAPSAAAEPTVNHSHDPETHAEPHAQALTAASTDPAPLHPMDCMDMVIGSVLNGRARIGDYYTRDRSTPLLDYLYEGSESLTGAYGIERDGRTVIMFRRKMDALEKADHPLGPGEMFVIWAKGQEIGSYYHSPPSAIETNSIRDAQFYKPNELKYHGAKNRGVFPIEFVTPAMFRAALSSASAATSVSLLLLFCALFFAVRQDQ